MARIRAGDREAFSELVRAYYRDLYDFGCVLTRSGEAAADILQDVLLRVWETHTAWDPPTSARAYLFRAVRNRALNYLRDVSAHRAADLAIAHSTPDSAPDPEADLRYRQLLADYQAAIEEMPERRQQVYRLNRLYGLTYEEVATVLDISINTVRTQMTDALAFLRRALGEHLE